MLAPVDALIYTLFLGYGISIGTVVYGYIDHEAVSKVHCTVGDAWYEKQPHSSYYTPFVMLFVVFTCLFNQARWSQVPVMLIIALAGYVVNFNALKIFDGSGVLSNSLGALCIGVLANAYSRMGSYIENWSLDLWEKHIQPRLWRLGKRNRHERPIFAFDSAADPESQPIEKPILRHRRRIGYGLAAVAMMPGVLLMVPSAMAVNGTLLSGVNSADIVTRNDTTTANGTVVRWTSPTSTVPDFGSSPFNVLFVVVQVSISLSVGLSLSALLVYPTGKKRSGLFSF